MGGRDGGREGGGSVKRQSLKEIGAINCKIRLKGPNKTQCLGHNSSNYIYRQHIYFGYCM